MHIYLLHQFEVGLNFQVLKNRSLLKVDFNQLLLQDHLASNEVLSYLEWLRRLGFLAPDADQVLRESRHNLGEFLHLWY